MDAHRDLSHRFLSSKARIWLIGGLVFAMLGLVPGAAEGAFPGTNGKIVYSSDPGGNPEIFSMDGDGSNQTNLTNNPAFDREPSVSADAQRIAFTSVRGGNTDIYVMDADGSDQTRLTTHAANDVEPAFSPDGQKIAFRSERDGNFNIYVMDADGSNQTQLTDDAASDFQPSFSPDGTKITFTASRDGNFEVYVMDADGSNETNITSSGFHESRPSFSPDGQKIALTTNRDGNFEIYVVDDDGASPVRLTNNAALDSEPVFSPDGDKIAFMSQRDGNNEIYVKGVVNETRLTNNTHTDELPNWAPADVTAPTPTLTAPADGLRTKDATPRIAGTAGVEPLDAGTVTVEIYRGFGGSPFRTMTVAVANDGTWSVVSGKLKRGKVYSVLAKQSDASGNTGTAGPNRFKVKR